MGNISKCIQLLCLLFESFKQKPQSAHSGGKNQRTIEKHKKNHTSKKRQTAKIFINPKTPPNQTTNGNTDLWRIQPHLFSTFPVLRVYRACQQISKEEHGWPKGAANLFLYHCKTTAVPSQPLGSIEALHPVFTWLGSSSSSSSPALLDAWSLVTTHISAFTGYH